MEARCYICVMSVWALISGGCKKHYSPPAITANYNYLVVEGVVAAGQDSTIINLSRTVNISGTTTHHPEASATVTVESDQNASYGLPETDSGKYAAAPLNLDNAHKYRLKISTADGQTYVSDYEPVKITPPIDTLGYNITANGINFYTSTHDPANNTHYYRWDYSETYLYLTPLITDYKYVKNLYNDTLESVKRTPAEQVHTCYITLNASTILINSSAALKQDVIQNYPVTQVPKDSEKILHRYTIILREYALTADAYEFWQNMKKNTQQIGTIFDAQPSEISGNIHCISNPSLPVLGYLSVSTVSQKRIFIDRSQLPVWPVPPESGCKTYGYCWFQAEQPPAQFTSGAVIPFGPITLGTCGIPPLPGYDVTVGDYTCTDCTYHLGGKNVKPNFWR
jgi:hypothetical protein